MIHRLKSLIKEKAKSQAWLADEIGTSPSVISDLCHGRGTLNERWISKICEALDCEIWEIFYQARPFFDKEDEAFIRRLRTLPEDWQDKIMKELRLAEIAVEHENEGTSLTHPQHMTLQDRANSKDPRK